MKFLFEREYSVFFMICMALAVGISDKYNLSTTEGLTLAVGMGVFAGVCQAIYEIRSKK